MSSWLRLNPDPHHASSITFPAIGGATRSGQSVEIPSLLRFSPLGFSLLRFGPNSVFAEFGFFMSLGRHISTAASTKFHHQSDGLVFVQ